jgi:hypothetical protein
LPGSTPLSRRQLLRGLGALGAAGLLAACGQDPDDPPPGAADGTPEDPRQAVLDHLGIDAPPDLNLVLPFRESPAGEDRRFVFGLATDEREFLSGLDVEVTVVRDGSLEVVHGPVPATAYEDFGNLGVYGTRITYPEPGIYRIAAVTPDRAAVGAVQADDPAQLPMPLVGDQVPRAETPTFDDPGDLEELCTREPDCSMHDVSLAASLEAGRPVVLSVATPAFCATAICGPVVDVIEDVRADAGRDDVDWIHVEVFQDAGNTPVPLIETLGLRSEPWTFFIDGEGVVTDQLEGPTPAELVREALETI